jgi:glycosyltransferase involved in cell wall biosynthesis
VTVVVPCYNYGRYLPAAVGSALTQPGVEVEVIVIDDASTDGSADTARRLAIADDRVRAIVHDRNQGHIATYNEGLLEAAGEYVVLLSADDMLTPGALRRSAGLMESHRSVGFVYGLPIEFVNVPPPARERGGSWTVWRGEEWLRRRCRTGRNCILSPEVVMRTSVQRTLGGYSPQLPHSGDLEIWLRAAAISDVGRVNGPPQAYYRVHDRNMHMTTYRGAVTDLEARLAAFERALTDAGSQLSNREELLAVARRAIATAALDGALSARGASSSVTEPVEAYLAFARKTWPCIQATRRWHLVVRLVSWDRLSARPPRSAILASRFLDARDRVRWRWWRRTGL